jgi:hypothetical protein
MAQKVEMGSPIKRRLSRGKLLLRDKDFAGRVESMEMDLRKRGKKK